MPKIILLLPVFVLYTFYAQAQQLYMPRNIRLAYEKDTRAMDGKPGKNYFQNKGFYDVQVSLDPATGLLKGFEKITYSNNSADTLKTLAIRFVNNVHKPTAVRNGLANAAFLTTGLHIESFIINGENYNDNAAGWGTVKEIKLKNVILPHNTATAEIGWSYTLSKESGREGRIDSTTFFVAYSYPRISVYDDYNGWDLLEHNGTQEFYNDFNDYRFSITVPKNYVVWATGNFLNPAQVLQPSVATRLHAASTTEAVVHIATHNEMLQGKVTLQSPTNTWQFAYDHITDFTFATSNHYVWDAGSTLVDTATGRRASMHAAYNHLSKDFKNSVRWGKNTLQYYSQNLPGVTYPYPVMTAVQGFGNMEFPMMVNDQTVPDDSIDARMLQDHEVAHTYFPFYMGINETRYGYMDEGWAVLFTYMLSKDLFGEKTGDAILRNSRIGRWNPDPSTEMDMPLITMSTQLTGKAYRTNTYNKAVTAYLSLYSLLGHAVFKKALLDYMHTWQGKHPTPWDFFFSINRATAKNLNWFWNNWFFSNHYMDVKIEDVKITENIMAVTVTNMGGLYIPVQVKVMYTDGNVVSEKIKVDDWKNNRSKVLRLPLTKGLRPISIEVDNGVFVDATPADNVWIQ